MSIESIDESVEETRSEFAATLLQPAKPGNDDSWTFLVLPKSASEKLPRRGRTSVTGTLNGQSFQATLGPDGQLSHWLKVSDELRQSANAGIGDEVSVMLQSVDQEPEPEVPADLEAALASAPESLAVWNDTTTIARLDWIHWVVSAKREKTRATRIENACDMLASGKRRVCCFDQSGFYSKSLGAPLPFESNPGASKK